MNTTLPRATDDHRSPHRSRAVGVAVLAFLVGVLLTVPVVLALTGPEVPTGPPAAGGAYADEPPANWDLAAAGADVMAEPGSTAAVVGSLAPGTVELESTGRVAITEDVLWREIRVPGATTGWVPAGALIEARPPAPPTELGIPEAARTTAEAIAAAAEAGDLERLATLALEGEMPFTASFGADVTTPAELVALWDQIGRDEVLRALTALVGLPDWYETAAQNADGEVVAIFVTPRFMHEPSNAENRRLLEEALGVDYVDRAVADGQYLGWRLGITADGDWRFFVSGD